MPQPILQTKNIRYSYDAEKLALRDVSVSIYAAERIAVIGSNGAGKSTFFLNINGVLSPDSGTVLLHEQPVTKKQANRLRQSVGIVFQDADNQIIASTVRAEVSFGPMNLRLPKAEVLARTEHALREMNITHLSARPPHSLSGGEKKRVSIADILAMQPEIIVFDEPTAALDPMNAHMLERVLVQLEAEGKTLLLSTHDVDFVYRWARRVLVFCDGAIIADGTPLEIFHQPDVLRRANLRRPMLLDVYESAVRHGLVPDGVYPTTPQQWEALLLAGKSR